LLLHSTPHQLTPLVRVGNRRPQDDIYSIDHCGDPGSTVFGLFRRGARVLPNLDVQETGTGAAFQ
jgi:hypothetical protein